MRVLGIDPGISGALVLIDTDAGTVACEPMPVKKERKSDGGWRSLVDEDRLVDIIVGWAPDVSWIEDVYSRKGEGPVGAFSFGQSKGVLRGALAGCRVPRRYVSPNKWKTDLKVGDTGFLITLRCNKLFPACAALLKSEGKREAAMITLWGCLDLALQVPPGLLPV